MTTEQVSVITSDVIRRDERTGVRVTIYTWHVDATTGEGWGTVTEQSGTGSSTWSSRVVGMDLLPADDGSVDVAITREAFTNWSYRQVG